MLTVRARAFAGASFLMLAVSTMPAVAVEADAGSIVGAGAAAAPVAARATVSGHVYDESGTALPGARVRVEGQPGEVATDLQGTFSVPAPEGDNVTITVDYLGRPSVTRSVTPDERGTALDIVMPSAPSRSGDIVVVGASLIDNTARALNQQRQADNTVTVLSSDAIGRFPDPNIAEALQRVPGIGIERDQGEGRYINVRGAPAEFSAVSVDGVQVAAVDPTTRAVDLDTLPSDIVSNIEVAKSLLPNQDADSISGAINISTRSPFDRKGFALTAMAGGSYNQFGKKNDKRASGAISNRFGSDGQFGILLSGSYSQTRRAPDNVENTWALIGPANARRFGVTETLFKDYQTKRTRFAGTGALEWRPVQGTRVYVRGSYARFTDNEFRNRLGILWTEGTLQPGYTDTSATYTNTRIEKQIRHRIQRNEIWSVVFGGETMLGEGTLSFDAAYTESNQSYPRRDELLFRSSLRPTQSYDFGDGSNLPVYSLFTTGEHLQTARYAFRENTYRSNTTKNDEFSTQIRMDLPTTVAGAETIFSVGGKFRDRNIDADEERLRDRRASAAPTTTLAGFLTDQESRNFDYALGNTIDGSLADQYFGATKAQSERRMPQSISADYTANEKVLGMFGMGKFQFGETTVITGLRVEATNFSANSPTAATPAKTDYLNFFPNLTVRQGFGANLIGRFALSRGINRPNFPQIVPRVLDATEGSTVRVELGNPDLNPTLSNNVDAGLEYYIRPLGIIAVNAFYKDLNDFRYTVTRGGTYQGLPALLTRAENAPNGELYGVEVNWQQQFTFLPGLLSGFGVFANYTFTKGHADLAAPYAGRRRFALPGQSKHMWNASLFYEKGPVNLRLAYTKRSDYLDEINADQPALDLYWEGRGQLDVTASYQLLKGVNLFFEGKNLTNTPGVRYFGERQRVYEYEKFGYTLFGGVRIKL
ncbi:MAG: TonB-dependent receptor [Sphingobium sp.]|nr:TonB-dependent receptor [Sphingobium sp.]